jgi:hypothetical protein
MGFLLDIKLSSDIPQPAFAENLLSSFFFGLSGSLGASGIPEIITMKPAHAVLPSQHRQPIRRVYVPSP